MSTFNINNYTSQEAYDIGCAFGNLCGYYDNSNHICPSTELRDMYYIICRYYNVDKIDYALMGHFLEAFSSEFELAYYAGYKCFVVKGFLFVDVLYYENNCWVIDTVGNSELYGFDNDTDDEN